MTDTATRQPLDIGAIRARLNAADGYPWRYEQRGQQVFGWSNGGSGLTRCEYRVADIRGWGHLQYRGDERGDKKAQALQDGNGLLIAHAPTDILALCDEIDALRSALDAALKSAKGE